MEISTLLISGFGVRVPDGAPPLTSILTRPVEEVQSARRVSWHHSRPTSSRHQGDPVRLARKSREPCSPDPPTAPLPAKSVSARHRCPMGAKLHRRPCSLHVGGTTDDLSKMTPRGLLQVPRDRTALHEDARLARTWRTVLPAATLEPEFDGSLLEARPDDQPATAYDLFVAASLRAFDSSQRDTDQDHHPGDCADEADDAYEYQGGTGSSQKRVVHLLDASDRTQPVSPMIRSSSVKVGPATISCCALTATSSTQCSSTNSRIRNRHRCGSELGQEAPGESRQRHWTTPLLRATAQDAAWPRRRVRATATPLPRRYEHSRRVQLRSRRDAVACPSRRRPRGRAHSAPRKRVRVPARRRARQRQQGSKRTPRARPHRDRRVRAPPPR